MKKRVIQFPSQRGRLVVFHSENEDQRAVGIYGDPEGLRSLGELLIAEAALNQRQIPEENLPAHERHHTHLRPGVHIHPQSIELIIGRLDSKETAQLPEWLHEARMKSVRPVIEVLSDPERPAPSAPPKRRPPHQRAYGTPRKGSDR